MDNLGLHVDVHVLSYHPILILSRDQRTKNLVQKGKTNEKSNGRPSIKKSI